MLTLALSEARAAAGEIVRRARRATGRFDPRRGRARARRAQPRGSRQLPRGECRARRATARSGSPCPTMRRPTYRAASARCTTRSGRSRVVTRYGRPSPSPRSRRSSARRFPSSSSSSERAALSERLVASFSGRRMHVELSNVELRGGGRIAGRVHLDRAPASGRLLASVRCIESWRMSPRPGRLVLMSRANAIPLWRQRVSFEQLLELESLDDAHWRAFSFELPEQLPPCGRGALDRLALRGRGAALRPDRHGRSRPDHAARVRQRARKQEPSCGSLGDPHEGDQLVGPSQYSRWP